MNQRFENSKKGLAVVRGWPFLLPREIFTAEKEGRSTVRMLVSGTSVLRLGTVMVRFNVAWPSRRELIMLGSEIGWVDEFNVRDSQE